MIFNIPNLDLVNINAPAKFGLIASIHSQDIVWKFLQESWAITVVNMQKLTRKKPNVDLVKGNAYAKI